MKRILIIFSVILITILPLKMATDNIYKNQVKTNKFSKVIKMEKKHQDKSLIIHDELFYYNNNKFNNKKIYSTDSKEFNLFLKNLVNNIKLFLEKKPNVNLIDNDQLINAYLNYLKNEKYYAQTTFEKFWWGFKWWITWNDFITILNNAGNNITRNAISNISVGTMAGYVIQFLAIKFPWVLKLPKIGLIILLMEHDILLIHFINDKTIMNQQHQLSTKTLVKLQIEVLIIKIKLKIF